MRSLDADQSGVGELAERSAASASTARSSADLLDHYIDAEGACRRIAERLASDLAVAREAVDQARFEVDRSTGRLARIQRGFQDGVLDDEDYRQQREQVSGELDAAEAALQRARQHAEVVEREGASAEGEEVLLRHLAVVKRAVAEGAGRAPDLHALRNTLGELFESVELVNLANPFAGAVNDDDDIPQDRPNPVVDGKAGPAYALLPRVRWSSVDFRSEKPIGQLTPVDWSPQYPPSDPNPFLARYCWWYSSA